MSKPYEKLCIGNFNKDSIYCKKCNIPFSCIAVKEEKEREDKK